MIEQNPFSLYDFLGYLIPGFFLIIIIMLLGNNHDIEIINKYVNYFNNGNMKAIYIFIGVIFSYIMGHAISYLSSVSIEKYSIWTVGYPSNYLFGGEKEFIDIFEIKKFHKSRFILRILCMLFLYPMILIDIVLGQIMRFDRLNAKGLHLSLKKDLNKKIKEFMKWQNYISEFSMDENDDWFRAIYHYVIENSPVHKNKLQNYVALYGFNRNICLCFILSFWTMLITFIIENNHSLYSIFTLMMFSIISYVFYCAFLKFYRKFTLEALMAINIRKEIES